MAASKRSKDTAAAEDTTPEELVESIGRLNLGLAGTADTTTATTDTTGKKEGTAHSRYNLRSRNKSSTIQTADINTGTKQAPITRYLPPYLRGEGIGTDTSSPTIPPSTTDGKTPVGLHPRPRTTGKSKSNDLNAAASAFQPQIPYRPFRRDIGLHAGAGIAKNARAVSAQPEKERKQVLKRPTPSQDYLKNANQVVQTIETPRQLLVVLDLNGTLLHRKLKGGSAFVARPKVPEFIEYLLKNHKVMVWSSAKPQNVNSMCKKLFTDEQHQQLIAVWARDTLQIPAHAYSSKVQVYKQLSWIWNDKCIQATTSDLRSMWDQSNTVLIDDSVEKAASEPHNLICLEEFQDRADQKKSDVLGQVVKYLELLKHEKDVSAFMQLMPFTYNPGEMYEWEADEDEEGSVALMR